MSMTTRAGLGRTSFVWSFPINPLSLLRERSGCPKNSWRRATSSLADKGGGKAGGKPLGTGGDTPTC